MGLVHLINTFTGLGHQLCNIKQYKIIALNRLRGTFRRSVPSCGRIWNPNFPLYRNGTHSHVPKFVLQRELPLFQDCPRWMESKSVSLSLSLSENSQLPSATYILLSLIHIFTSTHSHFTFTTSTFTFLNGVSSSNKYLYRLRTPVM